MNDLAGAWQNYTDWLEMLLPDIYAQLQPPASDNAITAFEHATGITLPAQLKTLYSINNGGVPDNKIFGLEFLSLENSVAAWQAWREVGQDNDDGASTDGSYPNKAIKSVYTNPKWIPIFSDGSGNNIGMDLDPDVNGTVGQVINFGSDEYHKFVIAASVSDFINLIMTYIDEGMYVLDQESTSDHYYYYLTDHVRPGDHLTDFLRSQIVPQDFVYEKPPTITYGVPATYTEYDDQGHVAGAFSVSFQMEQGNLTIFCPDKDLKKEIRTLASKLDKNLHAKDFLDALSSTLPSEFKHYRRTAQDYMTS